METAGVQPPFLKGAVISVFIRVLGYYKNCLTTYLTTFEKNIARARYYIFLFKFNHLYYQYQNVLSEKSAYRSGTSFE